MFIVTSSWGQRTGHSDPPLNTIYGPWRDFDPQHLSPFYAGGL